MTSRDFTDQSSAGDASANSLFGSDAARSWQQSFLRLVARTIVHIFRLNGCGPLATEILQAANPIATIHTQHGPLYCRTGHGRLVWRAKTFFDCEPETIRWIDAMGPADVFWDIGSNVGLYAIYAAKFRGTKTYAFEPEAQNFSLLIENISLNSAAEKCFAVPVAVAGKTGFGNFVTRYITKGGAYNHFYGENAPDDTEVPVSIRAADKSAGGTTVSQIMLGASGDDLVFEHDFPTPTHIKIDVDGLEPDIVDGLSRLLESVRVRSILVEVNENSSRDMEIPANLERHGFSLVKREANWVTRVGQDSKGALPCYNLIFSR